VETPSAAAKWAASTGPAETNSKASRRERNDSAPSSVEARRGPVL